MKKIISTVKILVLVFVLLGACGTSSLVQRLKDTRDDASVNYTRAMDSIRNVRREGWVRERIEYSSTHYDNLRTNYRNKKFPWRQRSTRNVARLIEYVKKNMEELEHFYIVDVTSENVTRGVIFDYVRQNYYDFEVNAGIKGSVTVSNSYSYTKINTPKGAFKRPAELVNLYFSEGCFHIQDYATEYAPDDLDIGPYYLTEVNLSEDKYICKCEFPFF